MNDRIATAEAKARPRLLKENLHLWILLALSLAIFYVSVSWIRFKIMHSGAGDEALCTHFTEVVTWDDVSALD